MNTYIILVILSIALFSFSDFRSFWKSSNLTEKFFCTIVVLTGVIIPLAVMFEYGERLHDRVIAVYDKWKIMKRIDKIIDQNYTNFTNKKVTKEERIEIKEYLYHFALFMKDSIVKKELDKILIHLTKVYKALVDLKNKHRK